MGLVKGMWRSFAETDIFWKDQGFSAKLLAKLSMAERYRVSYYHSHDLDAHFQENKTYCMFLGHARSGGSVTGALLDAHPNMVLADELDVLQLVSSGFRRDQIFHQLISRSERQTDRGRYKEGRDTKTYSYLVPGQWQGRFKKLQVIGNSKAGITTQRIARDPKILDQFFQVMEDIPVKFIVILRNPYDTISTMNIRSGRTLEEAFDLYFSNCEAICYVREKVGASDLFIVKHETFIEDPAPHLEEIIHFLNLDASDDYIQDCTSILYQSPSKSRLKVQWSPQLLNAVKERVNKYDFLQGYSFED
jgi:hypothetical protein